MRARVMATFMRRRSPRKPIRPLSLARTRLIMITSRSCPWKPSDRVDGYQTAERFEGNIALDQSADILNLRFVRRNQTEVNAFVQYPFLADLFDIFLQGRDKQGRFVFIDTAHAVGRAGLLRNGNPPYRARRQGYRIPRCRDA